jgi:hypothetical protein
VDQLVKLRVASLASLGRSSRTPRRRSIIRDIQSSGVASLRGIARSLVARGIATARGGEWTAVQVGSILQRAQK